MRYLTYGSNLHLIRLQERVPSAKLLGTTVINDRGLRFHKRSIDGSAKCNMIAAPGSVHAAVYRIAAREKPELDRVEGLGIGYGIETLEIDGYGSCYTYVAVDAQIDETLRPYCWYKELVTVGCEYLRFPQRYIDQIALIDTIVDPDRDRHENNMQIVERAREVNQYNERLEP